ncbi:MAG: hypothetical protein KGM97_09820, partial [Alphaproteobacteria bacterium]|nr:hypothetical protein [Alphaproteobacteria bacterium]
HWRKFAILPLSGSSGSRSQADVLRTDSPVADENAPDRRSRKYFRAHPLKPKNAFPICPMQLRGFPCLGRGAKRWCKVVAKHNGVRVRPRAHDDEAGWFDACFEKLHGTAKVLTAFAALTRPAARLP